MKSEVRHRETWQVTVHREEDGAWPDKVQVNPLSTRYMKPETVVFTLVAGQDHPDRSVEVFGTEVDGTALKTGRYHNRRLPLWLAAVVEDARQHWHLTPADIAGDWPDGPLAVRMRRLIMKWMSHARHPSRQAEDAEREREALQHCAEDLQDELTAWRAGRS